VAIPESFEGVRVTVMGLGLFGGGAGTARYLAREGARVTVTDLKTEADLAESVELLSGTPAELHLGGHDMADFTDAGVVVANPAVRPGSEFLAAARRAGVSVTTAAELAFRRCRELELPVIGVTGSNGKSTTTAMIGAMLSGRRPPAPEPLVGGNIGGSLLEELGSAKRGTPVVMELSSFQLHHLGAAGLSPHVAVVTNLAPNHIEWHGDVESYYRAKAEILRHQGEDDWAVLNLDDPESRRLDGVGRARRLGFSLERLAEGLEGTFLQRGFILLRTGGQAYSVAGADALRVPGHHNIANALAAAAAASAAGATRGDIARGLGEFRGLPDRMETIAFEGGVRYINDSVATTPESAAASLEALGAPGPVVILIAGGHDKGLDFSPLARAARGRVRAAALTGDAARRIADAMTAAAPAVALHYAEGVRRSTQLAAGLAREGETVLLSPGCSSYDEFRNYRDRAAAFRREVERLAADASRAGDAGDAGEAGGRDGAQTR